jgi:hypothetical protein
MDAGSVLATKAKYLICYSLTLAVISVIYGAIPFFGIPSVAQPVWISGFAQSFTNAGWPAAHAINFGIPAPAPIAFGFPGAFLQSTLMLFLRIDAADSYALGCVIWLGLGIAGCVAFARLLGAGPLFSFFLSMIYMTLPIVWAHSSYSMLSFAFALIPLYLFSAISLISSFNRRSFRGRCVVALFFCCICFLAIFMDGYTYVMFFSATGIIFLITFARNQQPRGVLVRVTAPIILLGAFSSYLAYTYYEEGAGFSRAPVEFFRGYGVDLLAILIPSKGASWLLDLLHLSIFRDPLKNFGDPSVWTTTFSTHLLVTGLLGLWFSKRHRLALPLLLISLFGFYLSLGPSLKIDSRTKGLAAELAPEWRMMPQELAPISTGSAFLDQHVPGFNSMRASYRWSGLSMSGLFGLTVLLVSELQRKKSKFWFRLSSILIVSSLILINLPDIPNRISYSNYCRRAMRQMAIDLIPLNEAIGKGRRVIFYPQGNDFIVNYISSMGGYYSYNIGGDKNLEFALKSYPMSVRDFLNSSLDPTFPFELYKVLALGDADCVVFPYFDLLWNADAWPPDEASYLGLKASGAPVARVSEVRMKYAPLIEALSKDPVFEIKQSSLFAVISLRTAPDPAPLRALEVGEEVSFTKEGAGFVYLKSGWSAPESVGTWSEGKRARICVNPRGAENTNLILSIVAFAFLPPILRSQEVDVIINGRLMSTLSYTTTIPVLNKIEIPADLIDSEGGLLNIEFNIKHPKSIWPFGGGQDTRQLGLNLASLSLTAQKP